MTLRNTWAVLAFVAFVAGSACSSKSDPVDASPPPAEQLSPVAVPKDLVADLFVPNPDATWAAARGLLADTWAPATFGGLVVALVGLPITAAGEIDGNVPALGAVLAPVAGGTDPRVALGLHVKVGDRFLDQLTKGEGARYDATTDGPTGTIVLTPKTGAKPPFALGMVGNYLLLAQTRAELLAAGPYIARNVARAAVPKGDLVIEVGEAALTSEIVARGRAGLASRIEQAGAPPLFAGKTEALFSILADAAHATVVVDVGASGIHARAVLTPKAGAGPATKMALQMHAGDAMPLLWLPASTHAALLVRHDAQAPWLVDAHGVAEVLLGPDASGDDEAAIGAAVAALEEAAGDHAALGFALESTGPALFLRSPAPDENAMVQALQRATSLLERPAVRARVGELGYGTSAKKASIEAVPGDVTRVRLLRREAETDAQKDEKGSKTQKASSKVEPEEQPPKSVDVLWVVDHGVVFAGGGTAAAAALRKVVNASDEQRLAASAPVREALKALGGDVGLALFVDPARFVAARAGKQEPVAAPVVFSLGRTAAPPALWAQLDVGAAAVRALAPFVNGR